MRRGEAEVAGPDGVVGVVDESVARAVGAGERGDGRALRVSPQGVVDEVDDAVRVVVARRSLRRVLGLVRADVDAVLADAVVTEAIGARAAIGEAFVAPLFGEPIGEGPDQLGAEAADARRPCVERRAAGQEGVGLRRAAVVGQGAEPWVDIDHVARTGRRDVAGAGRVAE